MAKLFLSFLGTNRYVDCCYQMERSTSKPVRYIQECTVGSFCCDWSEFDRIVVFTTAEARKKNWDDNGHQDGQPGLESCLAALPLKARVQMAEIPDGHTEAQLWEIFSIVLDRINQADEVIFDITHAFRSIPLLAIVILNYAKVVRKIKLLGVYYGAFEVLGNPRDVEQRIPDPCGRIAPVLDLTPLDRLLDWSFAVDKLLKAGDATAVQALAHASVRHLLKESKGQDRDAAAIRYFGDTLFKFTQSLTTCRAKEISVLAQSVKSSLSQCAQTQIINPLKPLIEQIENEVAPFEQDPVSDGIHAAKWCAKHHLTQQAITILHETLITWCVIAVGENNCVFIEKFRNCASFALDVANRNIPEQEWKGAAKESPLMVRHMIEKINEIEGIAPESAILRSLRNDINHAGMRKDSRSADQFARKLNEVLQTLERLLIV